MTLQPTAVRRVEAADWSRLRDLRLHALASDPAVFESSHDAESNMPDESWQTWAAAASAGPDQAVYLATASDRLVGIAGGFRRDEAPDTYHLISMWVDPGHRRSGVGTALIDAVAEWATQAGGTTVDLWVVDGADAARQVYEANGFEATGRSKPLIRDPSLIEHHMARSLALQTVPRRGAHAGSRVVVALDPGDLELAKRLVELQRAAYVVEAELIRSTAIPPLHDEPSHLAGYGLTWAGVRERGVVLAAIGYRTEDDVVDIDRLMVHPAYARQGLGRVLVEHASAGRRTTVSTGSDNHPARTFYEALGFDVVGHDTLPPGIEVTRYARDATTSVTP